MLARTDCALQFLARSVPKRTVSQRECLLVGHPPDRGRISAVFRWQICPKIGPPGGVQARTLRIDRFCADLHFVSLGPGESTADQFADPGVHGRRDPVHLTFFHDMNVQPADLGQPQQERRLRAHIE